MTGDGYELWEAAIPLRKPHATASGRLDRRRVIVVAVTAAGVTGWGECAPVPGYSPETLEECWTALASAPTRPEALPAAAAAAWAWAHADLAAREAGTPLWRHLGGERGRVAAGAVVGIGGQVPAGYRHVKLKIAPDRAAAPLREVRRRHPGLSLAADANGSYESVEQVLPLDDLELAYLEQPFTAADLASHAALGRAMATPVCLDESTQVTGWEATPGVAATVKPARVRPDDLARLAALAIPLRVGGMLETGIGRAAALAAATLPTFTLPCDLSPPASYLAADVVSPEWALDDGDLVLPDAPGIGVEVDLERLAAITVRRASFP